MKFLNTIDGASKVLTDPNHRFVTDDEKTAWNAKETPAGAQAKVDAHAAIVATENELGHIKLSDLPSGGGGVKTRRFVVGTSTVGWTAGDCDYLCDGTSDEVEINQAISALPSSGGEILILDGTYNITAKINVNKNNVCIKGNGSATILKRMYNSGSAEGVITLAGVEGCRVDNLQIDGNRSSYSNSNNRNIRLSSSDNNIVTGTIHKTTHNYGIELDSSDNNLITNNICEGSYYYGINVAGGSSDNVVSGNSCSSCDVGIIINFNSRRNTVSSNICVDCDSQGLQIYVANDNICKGNMINNSGLFGLEVHGNNNVIMGNYSSNNTFYGILVNGANNVIANNVCHDNGRIGISLTSGSNRNTVIGNTCIRGTGSTNDYASNQYTIEVNGNYNLISSNNCMGKAVVISGGTGNTEVNNKWE